MTVYKRLAEARVKLQETDIKKSGENKFAKFKYFELADFLPTVNKINNNLGLITRFSFDRDKAILEVISCEDGSKLEFAIPSCKAELKGATDIQMLGAEETYLRRYLMLAAYEITDGDAIDAQEPKKDDKKPFNREGCIKAILEFNKDDELETILNAMGAKGLNSLNETQLKEVYKRLKG